MAKQSRIAVIQPQGVGELVSRRAEQEPDLFRNHSTRLDVASEDFDVGLKTRVITQYAQHLCALLRETAEAGCDLALLPECTLPIGGPDPAARERMNEVCGIAEAIWLDLAARVSLGGGLAGVDHPLPGLLYLALDDVANSLDLDVVDSQEVADMKRTPVSNADKAHANLLDRLGPGSSAGQAGRGHAGSGRRACAQKTSATDPIAHLAGCSSSMVNGPHTPPVSARHRRL